MKAGNRKHPTNSIRNLSEIVAVMIVLQAFKVLIEAQAAPLLPNTRFADKMLTMAVMLLLVLVVVGYAHLRKEKLSVFPERFSKQYALCTVAVAGLFIGTPANYTVGFSATMVLIYASIVTPLYEELLFRGFIWNRLKRCCQSERTVYWLNALLFGLWHIGYMVPQLLCGNWFAIGSKLLVGLLYGLVLGFVRLKTGNCYATMLLHGVMNLFAF